VMKVLIVGAGLSGSTIGRVLADKGHTITIIEKRDHIAGNCYDYVNEAGILVNKYGAHLFHTNSDRVRAFVERFSEWVPWKHKVQGTLDGKFFPVPVNIDTVNTLCGTNITSEEEMKDWLAKTTLPCAEPQTSEDVALSRVGPELYEKIFKGYTFKQWAKYPSELDPSVLARIPVRMDWNPYYFSDKWEALPVKGYTAMVASMLDHPGITVELSKDYTHDMKDAYDYVFYTGPIDAYFASAGYETLEYRSIRFEEETLPIDQFQPLGAVNYPSPDVEFTRIIEYKHFLNQNVPGRTTIVKEYTMAEGDPYYPVPTERNQILYKKYQDLALKEKGVFFVGRLANYKYYNMDGAILAALEAADIFLDNSK
jgi:UDP-galactopyranose mutase